MAIDRDTAWQAFVSRDRVHDGKFVGAVTTTGIYCKPSCPARRPLSRNVTYFLDGAAARVAGYRACLRCRPDDVARDLSAVHQAVAIIQQNDELPRLQSLAAAVGYAPHHFHRVFKRELGVTPIGYARAMRAQRLEATLRTASTITQAVYAAGYESPSRFYADTNQRLGMTPSAWRAGGAGIRIRYAIVNTVLGQMLLAATERGICRLAFDETVDALYRRFPRAVIEPGGNEMAELVAGAIAACERPSSMADLPLDVGGTAFQQAVWQALRRIPAGETRSYAQIAAAVGSPAAVRATGSANGANQVAVLIPCHRVIRSDGTLGGYAYGLDRKRNLLRREADHRAATIDQAVPTGPGCVGELSDLPSPLPS